jgi:2-polyprenyl-3-methyl-5-hydroxy-6-metoxy-1,4-benzoquinol methylase
MPSGTDLEVVYGNAHTSRKPMTTQEAARVDEASQRDYNWKVQKEAEFWGAMARLRWRGGVPMTMDFTRATRYRVRRSELGWGDYFQDPTLERLIPFGRARIRFVEAAKTARGNRVLDLCCGAGWLALESARAGKEVDAVDLSLEEMTVAREYQATLEEEIPGQIYWIVADLNTFDAAPDQYDLVTAWDGLHHVQQIDRLCAEVCRALKPGGQFMMSERVWGGNQSSMRTTIGRYLEQHLWTVLPTPAPTTYRTKFRQLFDTYRRLFKTRVLRKKYEAVPWQIQGELCSPFEDACGPEMIDAIDKHFEIDRVEQYGAFTEEIQRSLFLPRFLRIPVLVILSWLDHLTIKLGLLEGKIVILYGHKRKPGESPTRSPVSRAV